MLFDTGFEKGTANRDRLNRAIFDVITTQYKKDAKEAHETVLAAGYEITKWDGRFWVKNIETGKEVHISPIMDTWRHPVWNIKLGNNFVRYENKGYDYQYHYEMCKVDFVGYLEKPYNKVYWELREARIYGISEARRKYEIIKDEARNVAFYGRKIETVQAKIKELEKELIYNVKRQAEAEQRLNSKRKELNLA